MLDPNPAWQATDSVCQCNYQSFPTAMPGLRETLLGLDAMAEPYGLDPQASRPPRWRHVRCLGERVKPPVPSHTHAYILLQNYPCHFGSGTCKGGVRRTRPSERWRFCRPRFTFSGAIWSLIDRRPRSPPSDASSGHRQHLQYLHDSIARAHHGSPPTTQQTIAIIQNLVEEHTLRHTEYVLLKTLGVSNGYIEVVYLCALMPTIYISRAL